jgi:hypothetical protein
MCGSFYVHLESWVLFLTFIVTFSNFSAVSGLPELLGETKINSYNELMCEIPRLDYVSINLNCWCWHWFFNRRQKWRTVATQPHALIHFDDFLPCYFWLVHFHDEGPSVRSCSSQFQVVINAKEYDCNILQLSARCK